MKKKEKKNDTKLHYKYQALPTGTLRHVYALTTI